MRRLVVCLALVVTFSLAAFSGARADEVKRPTRAAPRGGTPARPPSEVSPARAPTPSPTASPAQPTTPLPEPAASAAPPPAAPAAPTPMPKVAGIEGTYEATETHGRILVTRLAENLYRLVSTDGWEGVGMLFGGAYRGVRRC